MKAIVALLLHSNQCKNRDNILVALLICSGHKNYLIIIVYDPKVSRAHPTNVMPDGYTISAKDGSGITATARFVGDLAWTVTFAAISCPSFF